jgi:hypothetical protein
MNARQIIIGTTFAGLVACPAPARADDPYRPRLEEVAEVKAPADPPEELRMRKLAAVRKAIILQQQLAAQELKAAEIREQMRKKAIEKPSAPQSK